MAVNPTFPSSTTGSFVGKAGAGNNTFDASANDNYLSRKWTMNGSAGTEGAYFIGGNMADSLLGGSGNDYIYSGAGNDTINGNGGYDTLDGGTGNDVIFFSNYNQTITGGDGQDTLDFTKVSKDSEFPLHRYTDIEVFRFGIRNDTITGSVFANTIYAGAGNDVLSGLEGDDSLYGEAGCDTIYGNEGQDYLSGGIGNDILYGNAGDDTLDGGAGQDAMYGGLGDDIYIVDNAKETVQEDADEGTDTLQASVSLTQVYDNIENFTATGSGSVNILGNSLNNVITGNKVANKLYGGDGDDTISGGGGTDQLYGNDGADLLIYTSTVTKYDGGTGDDTVDASSWVSTATTTIDLTSSKFSGIETVIGTGGKDLITGTTAASETIMAGAGNDTIVYKGGDEDVIDGGDGFDIFNASLLTGDLTIDLANYNGIEGVLGGTKNDAITGTTEAELLSGNNGNDYINGGGGYDTLSGGAGNDTLIYNADAFKYDGGTNTDWLDASAAGAVAIDLSSTSFTGIENLLSGSGDDTLTGTTAANIINAGDGYNRIDGKGGADTVIGGADGDTVIFKSGYAYGYVDGGDGTDVLDATTSTAGVTIDLNKKIGSTANLVYNNIEKVVGSYYGDTLTGSAGSDILNGNGALTGKDSLTGGLGSDIYVYGSGYGSTVISKSTDNHNDYVEFTGGMDVSSLLGTTSGNDLVLTGTHGDSLTLQGYFLGNDYQETFIDENGQVYALQQDGTTYSLVAVESNDTVPSSTSGQIYSGTDGDDTHTGSDYADTLYGNAGDDLLYGGKGADLLVGGGYDADEEAISDWGYDTLFGGAGADTYVFTPGQGNYLTIGGDSQNSQDKLVIEAPSDPLSFIKDLAVGGGLSMQQDGNDLVMTFGTNGNVTLQDYYNNDEAGYRISTFETSMFGATLQFTGFQAMKAGDDTFAGTTGSDLVFGLGGNDSLLGGSGQDVLYGGSGDDTLDGGTKNDILFGGSGNDSIFGGAGGDIIAGGDGNDTLNGGSGNDLYLFGSSWGYDCIDTDGDTNSDWIAFFTGQDASEFTVEIDGNDARITYGGSTLDLRDYSDYNFLFASSSYTYTIEADSATTGHLQQGTTQYGIGSIFGTLV